MGAGQPAPGAVCDARLRDHRRVVVQAPGPVRGSTVYLQGDGGAHELARRDRRTGLPPGHRADREGTAEHRAVRVHPLLLAPGRIAGDLRGARQPALQGDSRPVVPGAQARGRHQADLAARDRRAVLQRRIRRHLRQHLRLDRAGLRLRRDARLRRPHPAGTAARARCGQDRAGRPAGRKGLDRAVQHQAGHAGRVAAAGAAGIGRPERDCRHQLL